MKKDNALRHRLCLRAALLVSVATCGVIMPYPSYAQLDNQTTIANPGRVESQISEDLLVPQNTGDVDVQQLQMQGAPPGSEKIIFKLGGLNIEGNNAYSDAALASLYKDKIGSEISLADVYTIANQLTLKYRNDGYILTQVVVPPQTIEGGIVNVRVVEGVIDRVSVQAPDKEGDIAVDTIRSYANKIKSSGAVNTKDLERQLLLINDLPGVKARSILSPSKNVQGAADLLIIVERKPYDAALSIDDYGSRYLGPVQLGAAGTLNSFFGVNDAISAQFVLAPEWGIEHELAYGSLGYEMPVGAWGTRLSVMGSVTDTEPGFDLEQFDVHGHSDFIEIKVTHPFIRSRSTNLAARALLDWRNVRSENDVEATREDHIRAARVGLRYEFLDHLLGVAYNVADLEVAHGLDILGSSHDNDPNLTRAFGDPEFSKANLELQRLQRITDDVNLLLEGRAQLASDALLSSEEFGVGGFSSGRGFDPSEIVGDDGISGRLELQWKDPGHYHHQYVEKYQLYGFYDAGRVWNTDATTSSGKRDTLNSAGAGVRANFASNVEGGLAVAFPLNREVQTTGDRRPRLYFNLSKKF